MLMLGLSTAPTPSAHCVPNDGNTFAIPGNALRGEDGSVLYAEDGSILVTE